MRPKTGWILLERIRTELPEWFDSIVMAQQLTGGSAKLKPQYQTSEIVKLTGLSRFQVYRLKQKHRLVA